MLPTSDPKVSVPKCMDIILQFGVASGYKINVKKTVLFLISRKALALSFSEYTVRSELQRAN